MSVVWLQVSAVALLAGWIAILVGVGRAESRLPLLSMPSDEAVEEVELEKGGNVPATTYTFARWEEMLAGGREACAVIVENGRWSSEPAAYNEFKTLCGDRNLSIVNTEETDWIAGRPIVHFDDPAAMPLLWGEGYYIQLVHGKSLIDLLREAPPFSIIILSVKDDGTQAFNHKWQEQLWECGIRAVTREYLRQSYLNIIWKKDEHSYTSLYEEIAGVALCAQYRVGDRVNDFKIPVHLEISSAGLNCGNNSSIRINGQEYSPNLRGMNIVIYDLIHSEVAAVHRVDTFVCIYEDTAIYRALPEEENHAS
ncbi:hypothetical protein PAECIP111893_05033 [Paenibacillus plantiphilus]|uniref:Uncharacterized protein n=1 Tax=Paenibacillus plantiphilus TaxID=2905650 RepID=A0ABN8H096_9BACL|nr:hypothetical protein [Paenibacillus plantiphilus]CAH1223719.1 hypothetical protein PAECIP111893_05033 [Paenibacillus plantiphilus]